MICNSYDIFFKTMADPSKLDIINLLSKHPRNVTELCEKLGFEQSRVSHNLRTLNERGFVNVKQKGKQRIYSLDKKIIVPLLKLIDKHVDKYYQNYCKCKGLKWRKKQ
ncbi:transcriptional regulator [Candidatus Woesearchaeota archaeon CG10_big_fil_rev_8_21_14_0_10_30_7]|nr:MAG: transcriptional regulator [Candidatus Woesearchaeota archaeon CG10_big_fil_rev_8_21_14_0_10_30_7]